MKKLTALAVASFLLVPTTAFAAELDLTNVSDFVPYQSSYVTTVDGVTVTFTALNNNATHWSTDLSYQKGDGFGVDSVDDNNGSTWGESPTSEVNVTSDEINGKESIKVTFSEEVLIESIAITDLYDSLKLFHYVLWPTETGAWKVTGSDGTSYGSFEGEASRTGWSNGDLTVDIGELATVLSVFSTNTGIEAKYKGFSLAGITFSTVKVPELSGQGIGAAAFLLFGAAQLLGARRRRGAIA